MDLVGALEQGIRDNTLIKSVVISGITLTLYDYLLMIDDEIRYVWRSRKTAVSYFYILNRITLIACRLWEICILLGPRGSDTECIAKYHAGALLLLFFLSSSDVFITLRIYAVTFKNKLIAAYFGIMALTRLAMGLTTTFLRPVMVLDFPPLPIDSSNVCPITANLWFKSIPIAVATAFELSAFLVIAWCAYRNMSTLKLSVVIRTIVTEATIYFLAMVAMQIYVQISFVLTEGTNQLASIAVYGILNPVLTMRFALSLRRSGDSRQDWRTVQVASVKFTSGPLSGAQASATLEGIEMGPVPPPKDIPGTRKR